MLDFILQQRGTISLWPFSPTFVGFVWLTRYSSDHSNRHLIANRICGALGVPSLTRVVLRPSHKSHPEPAQRRSAGGCGHCLLVSLSENEQASYSCDVASCFRCAKSPALVRNASSWNRLQRSYTGTLTPTRTLPLITVLITYLCRQQPT